jgi:hypothetical protein
LLSISEISGIGFEIILDAAQRLTEAGLLGELPE